MRTRRSDALPRPLINLLTRQDLLPRIALLLQMALLSQISLPAAADDLTLPAIFADSSLIGPAPRGVKVAPDGRRVGLLRGSAADRHQLDLWSYDVKSGKLQMRVDSAQLVPREDLSPAERARRERERTADFHGIVDYDWAPDGRRVLFTLGGNLYLDDLDRQGKAALHQLTHGEQAIIDPQVSPRGRYVSFVRNQDLWVIDLDDDSEHRLTQDGGGHDSQRRGGIHRAGRAAANQRVLVGTG